MGAQKEYFNYNSQLVSIMYTYVSIPNLNRLAMSIFVSPLDINETCIIIVCNV